MTEAETAEESDNGPFLHFYPSFMDINWLFSDDNAQQKIETSPEQRESIYNILNLSIFSSVSKTDFETPDIALATPNEHIELMSRDAENLYYFGFSLINRKTYVVMGKYDTDKSDYTDEAYLVSEDAEIIQRIKDCMNE
jgi:hypothetical protein